MCDVLLPPGVNPTAVKSIINAFFYNKFAKNVPWNTKIHRQIFFRNQERPGIAM
jgi:hypothetical protein